MLFIFSTLVLIRHLLDSCFPSLASNTCYSIVNIFWNALLYRHSAEWRLAEGRGTDFFPNNEAIDIVPRLSVSFLSNFRRCCRRRRRRRRRF
jgi:hypothetical protein